MTMPDAGEVGAGQQHTLDVREVSVTFGGVRALSQISLSARPGEILGIIGPNGAGKTTLLNAVCGLVPVDEGAIVVSGKNINGLSPSRIARLGLARTFQSSQIFRGMTVLENVMSGLHLSTRANFLGAIFSTPAFLREERLARKSSWRRSRMLACRHSQIVGARISHLDNSASSSWPGPWFASRASSFWTSQEWA